MLLVRNVQWSIENVKLEQFRKETGTWDIFQVGFWVVSFGGLCYTLWNLVRLFIIILKLYWFIHLHPLYQKKRGWWWQRMRWLDKHHWLNDMNLSKLQETVEDRGAWHAAVHEVAKIWTRLSNWVTTILCTRQWAPWGQGWPLTHLSQSTCLLWVLIKCWMSE